MRNEPCPHETAALRAEESGEREASLDAHVADCRQCREAVRIAGWMQKMAAATAPHRPLPDADLLWIKSRLFARQAAKDRAMLPLILGDMLARAIVGAFAAAWLALSWPSMLSFLTRWMNDSGTAELVQSTANPWPITVISAAAALALMAVVRVVHPMLTRD